MDCPATEDTPAAGGPQRRFRRAHSPRSGRCAVLVRRATTPPVSVSAPEPWLSAGTAPLLVEPFPGGSGPGAGEAGTPGWSAGGGCALTAVRLLGRGSYNLTLKNQPQGNAGGFIKPALSPQELRGRRRTGPRRGSAGRRGGQRPASEEVTLLSQALHLRGHMGGVASGLRGGQWEPHCTWGAPYQAGRVPLVSRLWGQSRPGLWTATPCPAPGQPALHLRS